MSDFVRGLRQEIKRMKLSLSDLGARLTHDDRLMIGFLLLGVSLILPGLVWGRQYNVLDKIFESMKQECSGYLSLASIELILLNSIRHFPIYIGTFIIADRIREKVNLAMLSELPPFNFSFSKKILDNLYLLPLFLIPFLMYNLITYFYDINFAYTGSSLLSTIIVFIVHIFARDVKSILIKLIIVSLFILSFSWLEITPLLSRFGFGTGELSVSIKHTADVIGGTMLLNVVGILISSVLIISGIILTKVVFYYNKYFQLLKESRKKERKLKKIEVEALESRYFRETQQLVHDLKTPLSTIQTLSGVIRMRIDDNRTKEYSEKIGESCERMSQIISEVLLEDKKSQIHFSDIIELIKSQISYNDYYNCVEFKIEEDVKIYVNKFRIARAIINLIDNSIRSIEQENGWVEVICRNGDNPEILIRDNGKGISAENIDKIWEAGFSTYLENTGLGLNFVKDVMDNHNGKIYLESEKGEGTEVLLRFPEVE